MNRAYRWPVLPVSSLPSHRETGLWFRFSTNCYECGRLFGKLSRPCRVGHARVWWYYVVTWRGYCIYRGGLFSTLDRALTSAHNQYWKFQNILSGHGEEGWETLQSILAATKVRRSQ